MEKYREKQREKTENQGIYTLGRKK